MGWWQYLLLVNLYLILFYSFYALLLRRETFFQLNRIYIVSSALLSFIIPLIQSGWIQNLFITQKVEYTIYSNTITINSFKPAEAAGVNLGELCVGLYLAGIVFFMIRLMMQLFVLSKVIGKPEKGAAYSFFKKIKLDTAMNTHDAITVHEQAHAKQWHSVDVLIMEAIMIVNWFNPVVYFYRRAIKHIHEFIADSRAVKTAANKTDYALLLISQTFKAPQYHLVNHFFNGSLLKQRIIMLQKNRSHRIALLKYGLSAPLFILMLILSSATVNNSKAIKMVNTKAGQVFASPAMVNVLTSQVTPKNITTGAVQKTDTLPVCCTGPDTAKNSPKAKDPVIFTSVEQQPEFIGGEDKLAEFLTSNIKYPQYMQDHNIPGKVIVSFVIEKDGTVSDVKAIHGPGYGAEQEAERVIALTSSKWIPAIQNHQYVRVQYTLPISFSPADNSNGLSRAGSANTDSTGKISGLTFSTKIQPAVLVILDGKETDYNTISKLDENSIQSVDVLKGKSAVAIYGSKAAKGVIVIKTKPPQ